MIILGKMAIVRPTCNIIALCSNKQEQQLIMKRCQVCRKAMSKSLLYFTVSKPEVVSRVLSEAEAKFYGIKGKAEILDMLASAAVNTFIDPGKRWMEGHEWWKTGKKRE